MLLTSDPICSVDSASSFISLGLCLSFSYNFTTIIMGLGGKPPSLTQEVKSPHRAISSLCPIALSAGVFYNSSSEASPVCSPHLFPIYPPPHPPSCCQAEEVCPSRDLICLVYSLTLWPQCKPQYRFDVIRCVTVMHESAAPF